MKTDRRLDITAGLICIVLALLILLVAIPLGVQEPKKVKFVALSPSYYPGIVAYFLLFFGALLTASRLFSKKSPQSERASFFTSSNIRALLVVILILSLYYASLNYLGFVLSSVVALFALLLMAGERKRWALVSIPVLLPFGLYFFFTRVANIPIPAGIIEPWLAGG